MKIIFCDLDGTLLMPGEKILNKNVCRAIEKVLNNNIIFCVASGRSYSELKRIMKDFDEKIYFIPSDGSQIVYKEETLYESPISQEDMAFLETEKDYVLHGKYLSYVKSDKNLFVRRIKEQYNGLAVRIENYTDADDKIFKISLYDSKTKVNLANVYKDYSIREYVNPSVNKGSAVKELLKLLSIDKKDAYAIGDSTNDVEMFSEAGQSFAMIQAPPYVKKKATGVVLTFPEFADKAVKE